MLLKRYEAEQRMKKLCFALINRNALLQNAGENLICPRKRNYSCIELKQPVPLSNQAKRE
jgi:hypothetical protein